MLQGDTYGDLAEWAIELRGALREANADKRAIQEWSGTERVIDK